MSARVARSKIKTPVKTKMGCKNVSLETKKTRRDTLEPIKVFNNKLIENKQKKQMLTDHEQTLMEK